MEKFYFTYGLEGYPFQGGWTTVIADNEETAIGIYRVYHPDRTPGILNCASIYSEEQFKKTNMYKNRNNYGKGLCEVISGARITCEEETS